MIQMRLAKGEFVVNVAQPDNKRYPYVAGSMGPQGPVVVFFISKDKAVNFVSGEIADVPEAEFQPVRVQFDSLTQYAPIADNKPAEAPIIIPAFVTPPTNPKKA